MGTLADGDLAALRAILMERGESLRRLPNVVGTGIGKRQRGGAELDELCIRVYVERKVEERELRDDAAVPRELRLPGVGAAPTDVEETGRPRPLQLDTAEYWPVRGGCALLPEATGARGGTLGGIAFDRHTHDPVWITNRHCIWMAGNDPVDPAKVWQPSATGVAMGWAYDVAPMVFYGSKFDVPGQFHMVNPLDAAKGDFTFIDESAGVSFSVVEIGPAIFEVDEPWGTPFTLGTPVVKHGIATGTTEGHVQDI